MYTCCAPVFAECLSEEETSAAAARKPSILLKKCSVRGRAGTNPVFCAVSTVVLNKSAFYLQGLLEKKRKTPQRNSENLAPTLGCEHLQVFTQACLALFGS